MNDPILEPDMSLGQKFVLALILAAVVVVLATWIGTTLYLAHTNGAVR